MRWRCLALSLLFTFTPAVTWAAEGGIDEAFEPCPGDCNGNHLVVVNELLMGVGVALGHHPLSLCDAVESDGAAGVAVSELVLAVDAAMAGCPGPSPADATTTPSLAPSPQPTRTPTPRSVEEGGCVRTGCSGHICASRHLVTTCEWNPEYACWRLARCAPTSDPSSSSGSRCAFQVEVGDDAYRCLSDLGQCVFDGDTPFRNMESH
jgi:hypothetical protein